MRSILPSLTLVAAALALPAAQAQSEIATEALHPSVAKFTVFDGLWCGTGLLHEFSLRLAQQHLAVQGTLVRRERVREIEGRVDGAVLRTQNTKIGSLILERTGDLLRVTGGDGPIALITGATFQRSPAGACAS